MSFCAKLAEMVRERGKACADDLLPELAPYGYSRQQVITGLNNAAKWGHGIAIDPNWRRGFGPAVFFPVNVEKPIRRYGTKRKTAPIPTSVFNLAEPTGRRIPMAGTVHRLAGEW